MHPMGKSPVPPSRREDRVICLPFPEEDYPNLVREAHQFRANLDCLIERYPELFPPGIEQGYWMKDSHISVRMGLLIRRIEVAGVSYTVRPAFATPYLTGRTDEVEAPLFLRKFSVPFWALAHVFGRNAMYWYRLEQALGRQSLVGTTVRHGEDLPVHLVVDEKHSRILGKKLFVATTCGAGCVLGVSLASQANEPCLTQAYGVFKTEARQVQPDYVPETANTDGWQATQLAWHTLFSSVILIACFLHVYIKLRDRAKKKFSDWFTEVSDRLWRCYRAPTKASFSQRLRRLHEWAVRLDKCPVFIQQQIEKLHARAPSFTPAYDFPEAHRTSNLLDRLMHRMDHHLFCTQYFHGSLPAAEYSIRAWALIQNFAPSNPYTIRQQAGWQSPAERLNQFRYHHNWLQYLFISGSQRGRFWAPLNL